LKSGIAYMITIRKS